jgi:hypothetical protein
MCIYSSNFFYGGDIECLLLEHGVQDFVWMRKARNTFVKNALMTRVSRRIKRKRYMRIIKIIIKSLSKATKNYVLIYFLTSRISHTDTSLRWPLL